MYRSLDPEQTLETVALLSRRIGERFPASGLSRVCAELCAIATESRQKAVWFSRPNYALRCLVAVVILLSVSVLGYSIAAMDLRFGSLNAGDLVQVLEAGINDVVLIGAALFFLVTVEARVKRSRALLALHELRTIAHVIDMHQLTKDPSLLRGDAILTPSSPRRRMSFFELTRYLDYCSEMLSLTGKIAALYAQELRDAVVLSAVNEIEVLTTALSRKIWQKIMILHKLDDAAIAEDPRGRC